MARDDRVPPPPRDSWADALAAAEAWGRDRTLEEHGLALRALCRAAMTIVRARPDAEDVLAYRDPLPESSRALIERLKERRR